MNTRHTTKVVHIGAVTIGGGSTIAVQSMTTVDTRDAVATVSQIHELSAAGCDIVRVAVPDMAAADALPAIVKGSQIPVVADIHFDYRLALAAIKAGVQKLRINPGNIGDSARVREVAHAAMDSHIPIRIGVNAGSLKKELMAAVEQDKITMGAAMAESALLEARTLEECGMDQIVLSVKSSKIPATLEAYRILARTCRYPLHVGITEAGTVRNAVIKSSVGIGTILSEGIGDTLRVSITGPPLEEVIVGRKILQVLELRAYGPEIISCPTCGRTDVDVTAIADELERRILLDESLKHAACTVAVMGCVVNGPGEAGAADVGFAGGKQDGILFSKGVMLGKISADQAVDRLLEEIRKITKT